MKKLISITEENVSVLEELNIKCRLESPIEGEFSFSGLRILLFRGWIIALGQPVHHIGRIVLEKQNSPILQAYASCSRADVLKNFCGDEREGRSSRCGFEFQTIDFEGEARILIEINGKLLCIFKITCDTPQVVERKNGYLFLGGDSNQSISQHTGMYNCAESWIEDWNKYLFALREHSRNHRAKHSFLLSPSKEEIFPDYYPFDKCSNRPIQKFLEVLGSCPELVWPSRRLFENRELSYDKIDTHWTDYGAQLASEMVLDVLGVCETARTVAHQYAVVDAIGDLGHKLKPLRRGQRLVNITPNKSLLAFDNKIINHGSILIYVNPEASIKETIVIFGGSSSVSVSRYLAEIFSRTICVHSAAAVDRSVLELEKPGYILC